MGKHREALRRIVAEAEGDPERVVAFLLEWAQREGAADPNFTLSVLEEFGATFIEGRTYEAITDAFTATGGDWTATVTRLREALDERENPAAFAAVQDEVYSAFLEAVTKVLEGEIARYEGQQPPSGG